MPALANHYRRTLALLWLVAALLLGLTWWHVSGLVSDSRAKELTNAERDLANLTRVSQEHASRTFRNADQVIRFIQARYLELGNKLDLTGLTEQGVIDAEIFPQVGIIDARGIYVLANRPTTGKLDLSDREHFKVHVAASTDELFISKPVLGRATGKWSIQLTRRITLKDGQFGGVVVVSIDPGYFTRFYSELKLGSQGMLALYGLDGTARARKVDNKEEFGSQALGAPMFEHIAKGQLEGSYTRRSQVDSVERLLYYRKIPGYDLVVSAGMGTQSVLANHTLAMEHLWAQAAAVSLLILALAVALARYLSQIRREMDLRQLAQRQIADRNEQLNAVFDLSPDGFVSFDVQRRVKYSNPAFAQMTGLGREQLEGMDEHDFSVWLAQRCTPGTPFLGMAALRAQVSAGKSDKQEQIELSHHGKRVLQLGLRSSQSSTVSQILYLRDVTHETEVDHMKSEFLATAAHELRTPMACIFGYAEILVHEDFDTPTRNEFLTTIYQQSRLMTNILNELLDLARIEARRDKDFRYTRVELQELLADIAKTYALPAGRAAPALDMPNQPLYLMADAGKLRQALLNVISNAYKYSPNGGAVQVRAWTTQTDDQASGVCVEVTDHGMGMTAAQVARVCERFYRADTSGKVLGTGLGMSIVKEIIALHRGTLDFDSSPGTGTCVRLCLPAYATLHDGFDIAKTPRRPVDQVAPDTRPAALV